MSLISVIIPVYNVEKHIEKCLHSVLAQTYHHYEIILVDDQSPDDSLSLANAMLKTHPSLSYQIITHKTNGGLSAARNTGLENAKGDYILFLDSDDWIDNDMLETLLNNVNQHHADIAICGYRHIYENGDKEEVKPKLNENAVTGEAALLFFLQGKFAAQVWKMLFSKHLFKNIRFPEGKIYEDVLTLPYLLEQAGTVTFTNRILYNYLQQRKGAITCSFNENIITVDKEFKAMRYHFKNRMKSRNFRTSYRLMEFRFLSTLAVHAAQQTQEFAQARKTLTRIKKEVDILHVPALFFISYANKKSLAAIALLKINLRIFFFYFNNKQRRKSNH